MTSILHAFILTSALAGGPSQVQPVLQCALNFAQLHDHLDSNSVSIQNEIKYIKADKRLPSDLLLTFGTRLLALNNSSTSELFFQGNSFIIDDLVIGKKEASVSYQFIPRWATCSSKPIQISGAERWNIKVRVKLSLINGIWSVTQGEMTDIEFGEEAPECLIDRYRRIGE